jgi:hypothetical protein
MKRNIGRRIRANVKNLKEDLMILQKQIQGRSVYNRVYSYDYKRTPKHKKIFI